MKELPPIGSRVRLTRRHKKPNQVIDGTVRAHYPSYGHKWKCPDTGEMIEQLDAISMQVDAIPEWWPYPGTDLIAPDIDDIEPI